MDVRFGIVGTGYWGNTYARVLKRLKIPFWQDGRYWHMRHAERVIIACSSEAHYEVAKCAMGRGIAVLIEKPLTMDSRQAWELAGMGGVAMCAHTRVFDPAWKDTPKPKVVHCSAGGVNETNPDPIWNWGPHLAAMCIEADVEEAFLHITKERQPLRWGEFTDTEGAMDNMVREFCELKDNRLRVGAQAVEFTEALRGLFSLGAYEHFHARRIAPGRYSVEPRSAE